MFFNTAATVFSILGSIALFLFGMKMMSESLQIIAGKRLRRILSTLSSNSFRGLFSGTLVTASLQSSSAVTVLLVSFVSAGLIGLQQVYGLILGANIGTTATGWIVSLLGFNVRMEQLSLPIMSIGLPLLFSRKVIQRKLGEFMIGFALLFIGLMFLQNATPDLREAPELAEFLSKQTGFGFLSRLWFLLIGVVVTAIIQSSSAAMAFTLVLAAHGWIELDLAAAMILGENIGTTVTANIAAMVGNRDARITARIHLVFNTLGAFWAIILLGPFLAMNEWIIQLISIDDQPESAGYISVVLAAFHSTFNIVNALLLIGFPTFMIRLSSRLVRKTKEKMSTGIIESNFLTTSELSLIQTRAQVAQMSAISESMLQLIPLLLLQKNNEKYLRLQSRILQMSRESAVLCQRIQQQLEQLTESSLSNESSRIVNSTLRIVNEIEETTRTIIMMSKRIDEKNSSKIWFTQELRDRLGEGFRLTQLSLRSTTSAIKELEPSGGNLADLSDNSGEALTAWLAERERRLQEAITPEALRVYVELGESIKIIFLHTRNIRDILKGISARYS